MKPRLVIAVLFYSLASVLVLVGSACVASDRPVEDKTYYGIEINGVLCGYAETQNSPIEQDGREMTLVEERIFMMLKALGMNFDSEINLVYHIDPETGKFTYQKTDIKQGPTELGSTVRIEGDTARFASTLVDGEKAVPLPPDVVLESSFTCDFLFRDFRDGTLEKKTYDVFEAREGVVQRGRAHPRGKGIQGHRIRRAQRKNGSEDQVVDRCGDGKSTQVHSDRR
jgi:hypothetical protein